MRPYRHFCNTDKSAFTLIEVTLAAAIAIIIIGAVFGSLHSSQIAYNQGMTETRLQEAANRVMSQIVRMIKESRVVSVGGDGMEITLQVPVDHDADGDVIDGSWNVEYGTKWGGADHLDGTCKIIFEVMGNSSESALDSDLNQDGDQADNFTSGRVHIRCYNDTGVLKEERTISGNLIFVGDVDGDGSLEPIFERVDHRGFVDPDGKCILAMFMVMLVGRDGVPHVLDMTTMITPRNPSSVP